jgi:hypothetical protein
MTKITKRVKAFVITTLLLIGIAGSILWYGQTAQAFSQNGTVLALKGFRGFFDRHPRVRKAAKSAAIGAGIGTGVGIITGAGVAGSAAGGAARSGGFSLVRTSKTWKKGKEKLTKKSADKKDGNQSRRHHQSSDAD